MGKKNVLIGVRVDEELAAVLKELAEKQDRSVSYITRNLLADALKAKGLITDLRSGIVNRRPSRGALRHDEE